MLLTLSERKRAAILLCMILIMASLDMLGVASILPFIAVLANPELVQTNSFLNMLFSITLTWVSKKTSSLYLPSGFWYLYFCRIAGVQGTHYSRADSICAYAGVSDRETISERLSASTLQFVFEPS